MFRIITRLIRSDVKYHVETDLLKEEHSHGKSIAKRKKYVLMIGSVILVYSVYLTTYAVIQGMHLVNITRLESEWMFSNLVFLQHVQRIRISSSHPEWLHLHEVHVLLVHLVPFASSATLFHENARIPEHSQKVLATFVTHVTFLFRTLFPCYKNEQILTTDGFKRHSQPTDI